jgi:hypothetical protein
MLIYRKKKFKEWKLSTSIYHIFIFYFVIILNTILGYRKEMLIT